MYALAFYSAPPTAQISHQFHCHRIQTFDREWGSNFLLTPHLNYLFRLNIKERHARFFMFFSSPSLLTIYEGKNMSVHGNKFNMQSLKHKNIKGWVATAFYDLTFNFLVNVLPRQHHRMRHENHDLI